MPLAPHWGKIKKIPFKFFGRWVWEFPRCYNLKDKFSIPPVHMSRVYEKWNQDRQHGSKVRVGETTNNTKTYLFKYLCNSFVTFSFLNIKSVFLLKQMKVFLSLWIRTNWENVVVCCDGFLHIFKDLNNKSLKKVNQQFMC